MTAAEERVLLTKLAGARCSTMGCALPAVHWMPKTDKLGRKTGRWQCATCRDRKYSSGSGIKR